MISYNVYQLTLMKLSWVKYFLVEFRLIHYYMYLTDQLYLGNFGLAQPKIFYRLFSDVVNTIL